MSGFKKHKKGGVIAHGTVHRVERSADGKTGTVTLQHEKPKKKPESKGGVYGHEILSHYPQESRHEGIPVEHLDHFPVGSKASVHLSPAEEIGESEAEGGEVGGGAENEDAEEAAEEKGEKAVGAKGPKQAKKGGSLIRAAARKRA